MKKIFLIVGVLFAYSVLAQPIVNLEHFDKQRLHWGYYFGVNTLDFKMDYKILRFPKDTQFTEVIIHKNTGVNIGLTGDVRLVENLNLRFEPGLFFNVKRLEFPWHEERRDRFRTVNSPYLYFPLLLKYSTKRWNNIKPYIIGGASAGINLGSKESLKTDNQEQHFRLKRNNFFYEVGFGIDFYTPYFRFSPSIKGLFSLRNEFVPDNDAVNSLWTSNINGIYTRAVMINLTFE